MQPNVISYIRSLLLELQYMTIPELKIKCREAKLPVNGFKSDLIKRVALINYQEAWICNALIDNLATTPDYRLYQYCSMASVRYIHTEKDRMLPELVLHWDRIIPLI